MIDDDFRESILGSSPNAQTTANDRIWFPSSTLRFQVLSQQKHQPDVITSPTHSLFKKISNFTRFSSRLLGYTTSSQHIHFSIPGFKVFPISERILVVEHHHHHQQYSELDENKESLSNVAQLALYLENKYGGHYFLWHLSSISAKDFCSCFDPSRIAHSFSEALGDLIWMPPPILILFDLVKSMAGWLKLHKSNVVVVICKDGLNRSGLVITCLLFYLKLFKDIFQAYTFFISRCGISTSKNTLLPSFRRSMCYFQDFYALHKKTLLRKTISIKQIIINTIPLVSSKSCSPGIAIFQEDRLIYNSFLFELESLASENKSLSNVYEYNMDAEFNDIVDINDVISNPSSCLSSLSFSETESITITPSLSSEKSDLVVNNNTSVKKKFPYFKDTNHIIFHFTESLDISGDIYIRLFHVPSNICPLYKNTSTISSFYFNTDWIDYELTRFALSDLEICSPVNDGFHPDFAIDFVFDLKQSCISQDRSICLNVEDNLEMEAEFSSLSQMIGVVPEIVYIESLCAQGIPRSLACLSLKIFSNDIFLSHEFCFKFCQQFKFEDKSNLNPDKLILKRTSEKEEDNTTIESITFVNSAEAIEFESKIPISHVIPQAPSNTCIIKQNSIQEKLDASIPPPPPPPPLPKKHINKTNLPPPPPLPKNLSLKQKPKGEANLHLSVSPHQSENNEENEKLAERKKVTKSFLEWKGMTVTEIKGTIWEDINNIESGYKLDRTLFEALFCIDPAHTSNSNITKSISDPSLTTTASTIQSSIFSLIDLRRANNISIGCSSLSKRYAKPNDLINILYTNPNSIGADDLLALRQLIPTPEEKSIFQLASKLKENPLNSYPELFILSMSFAPALTWIIDTMILQRQLESECVDLTQSLVRLQKLLVTLRNSHCIKQILRIVLEGCYLATIEFGRSKSQRQQLLRSGATKSVKVSTLSRLSDFRSENGQKSLLHFISESLSDAFIDEIKDINNLFSESKGMDISLLKGALNELRLNIEKIKTGPPIEKDHEQIKTFLSNIHEWIETKNAQILELSKEFDTFYTLWIETSKYFGERNESEFEDINSSLVQCEEFLKGWEEFLQELVSCYSKIKRDRVQLNMSLRPNDFQLFSAKSLAKKHSDESYLNALESSSNDKKPILKSFLK